MSTEITSTQFLDLEDISLCCLFQYLPMRDRFTLFFGLPPCRIQPLLENFISFVNIVNEDDKWIEEYLPTALRQQIIVGLRLKEKQIHMISKSFSLGDIQRIDLISTYFNDEFSTNDCISLGQSLNKLVFLFDKHGRYKQIHSYPQRRGENLYNRYLYPIIGQNHPFENLTDLSIQLLKISHIFNVLQRLPNLQILKMHLEISYVEENIDINGIRPCAMLRDVTITGETKYHHEFEQFFIAFGSTIQLLTLNVTIRENQHFLAQFERDLLAKMPLLLSFKFLIEWSWRSFHSDETFTIDIQIFENNNWQQFGPAVCWNDRPDVDIKVCNLPYKFSCFVIRSEELNLLYTRSKNSPLVFEHVRTVLLTSINPWWSMKTFNFIRNTFPNIRTLYFQCSLEEVDYSYIEAFDVPFPQIFANDFLNNNQIQLPTVTTLCLSIEHEQFTNQTFQFLFYLLPNLTVIKTNILDNARKYQERSGHYYNHIVNDKLNSLKIEPLNLPKDCYSITDLFYYLCEEKHLDSVSIPFSFDRSKTCNTE